MKHLIAGWLLVAGILCSSPVDARTSAEAASNMAPDRSGALGMETYRLWPGRAPQAGSDSADETPTLTIFRPQPGTENGTAVIVAPGGGYVGLASVLEGRQVADWFSSRGITAFVLIYRVGAAARLPVPLLDGSRAVRFVRANAAKFKINVDRIGMIGFSAGGHLTATTASAPDDGLEAPADAVDRASNKVNFVVLAYPWLEGMAIGSDGTSQYCRFQTKPCDPHLYEKYQPVNSITERFPPTFIYHTTADSLVRSDGILHFYEALTSKKVPVEMHIFANGPHGTGLGGADPALALWPTLLEEWLRSQGLLKRAG